MANTRCSLWVRSASRRSSGSRNSKRVGWRERPSDKHSNRDGSTNGDLIRLVRRLHRWRIRHDRRSWGRRKRQHLDRLLERVAHRHRLGDRRRGTGNPGVERHQIRRARSDDGRRRAVGGRACLSRRRSKGQRRGEATPTTRRRPPREGTRGRGRGRFSNRATCVRAQHHPAEEGRRRYHSRKRCEIFRRLSSLVLENHTPPIYPTNCPHIIAAPCRHLISEPLNQRQQQQPTRLRRLCCRA